MNCSRERSRVVRSRRSRPQRPRLSPSSNSARPSPSPSRKLSRRSSRKSNRSRRLELCRDRSRNARSKDFQRRDRISAADHSVRINGAEHRDRINARIKEFRRRDRISAADHSARISEAEHRDRINARIKDFRRRERISARVLRERTRERISAALNVRSRDRIKERIRDRINVRINVRIKDRISGMIVMRPPIAIKSAPIIAAVAVPPTAPIVPFAADLRAERAIKMRGNRRKPTRSRRPLSIIARRAIAKSRAVNSPSFIKSRSRARLI